MPDFPSGVFGAVELVLEEVVSVHVGEEEAAVAVELLPSIDRVCQGFHRHRCSHARPSGPMGLDDCFVGAASSQL
jgi:hypothetical protein